MPILFDSSVYITALRPGGDPSLLSHRWTSEAPLWLSSVVLEELHAGSRSKSRRELERLERDFDKARRLLVPNLSDWTSTGRILAGIAEKYGYEKIGQARLTNDALIAVSSARLGIRVLTLNARDYALLATFCPLQWEARSFKGPVNGPTSVARNPQDGDHSRTIDNRSVVDNAGD